MPKLTPCTVVVSFGSEKLEGVGVLLRPKDMKANKWAAGGKTNADGKTELKTAAHYLGVVPGEYVIAFQKYAPDEFTPDGMGSKAKLLTPKKYAPGQSKETITVTESQKEYIFELDALK
ncbi:hypothetical protein FACS189419_08130 [Planctomycetales bacterium]|nr:hypothetical protein FACS189419_08130 [Planctomycetales bacterium]